ncbi:MAG: 3'-5' exonuclease [Halieaceae bacterium]|jgi:DNA polymerase-3 subunit epsilon|nr:3'-5' exonuclease [Halieaceae bacterium]
MRLLGLRRRWARARAPHLPPELEAAWQVPVPSGRSPVESLSFLVCDAEMSGLDASRDALLSLAWVALREGELCLDSAQVLHLRSGQGVGQSATIHRLRDCDLEAGMKAEAALRQFLLAAAGHVLVFHHAALDLAFLDRACRDCWGVPLLIPSVDTLRIEARRMQRSGAAVGSEDLRLARCRERYGLASHRGHAALADAMATGELFLAQLATRGGALRLGDLR